MVLPGKKKKKINKILSCIAEGLKLTERLVLTRES